MRRAVNLVVLLVVVAALGYCAWFRSQGGRWERVESPSMGTTAPVGTLLWLEPVDPATVRVGDFISFARPGGGPVYSHRVRAVLPNGDLETRGDLSGPDQWVVQPSDVRGRVVRVWPGAGWLMLAVPILVVGATGTALASRLRPRGRRMPLVMLGCSVTVSVAIAIYRPLTGAEQLGLVPRNGGGMQASFVATGLFPIRVTAPDLPELVLHSGQDGSMLLPATMRGGFRFGIGPDLPWWFWLAVIGAAFVPSFAVTSAEWVRRRGVPAGPHESDPRDGRLLGSSGVPTRASHRRARPAGRRPRARRRAHVAGLRHPRRTPARGAGRGRRAGAARG